MSLMLHAPAKINLWLRLFPPDQTGYHPLDTLFCAIELADEITIDRNADRLELDVVGAGLGDAEKNLAYRAAQEFFAATGLAARAAIRLHKRIPAGAGLGGGSSDAAAVLRGLNDLHEGVLSARDLLAIGARLGSDVAFFLCGSSLAHATGRGEMVRGLQPLPSRPMIVVAPGFSISTADAYRWLDEAATYSKVGVQSALPENWQAIAQHADNAFEPVIFRKYEMLGAIKEALRDSGAIVSLLSGSGSTLFGIYPDRAACAQAAAALRSNIPDAAIMMTATRG